MESQSNNHCSRERLRDVLPKIETIKMITIQLCPWQKLYGMSGILPLFATSSKSNITNTVTFLVGPPTIQSRVGLYPPVRRVSNRINQDVVMLRSKARSQVLPRSLYQRILYFSNSYTPCDVNTSNEYTYKSFL